MPENDNDRRLYEVMQTTTKMSGQMEGIANLMQVMNKRLDKLDSIAENSAVQNERISQLEGENEQIRSEVETLRRDSIQGDAELSARVEKLERADGTSALNTIKSLKKTIAATIIGVMIPTLIANIGVIVNLFSKK